MMWTTRDGSQIPIHEMDHKHLVNTLLMVRRGSWKAAQKKAPGVVLGPEAWQLHPHKMWDALINELRSRDPALLPLADLLCSGKAINEERVRRGMGRYKRRPNTFKNGDYTLSWDEWIERKESESERLTAISTMP